MDASDTTTTTTTSSSWRASSPSGRASSSSSPPPPPPHSSSPAPAPGAMVVVVSPCAACKILRRRCVEKCVLAPYFPPSEPLKFTTAHRVFGASNIIKFLQELPEEQRADAVSSMVYEANARIRDPVYGCAGAICQLQKQVSSLQGQLAKAQAEVLSMRTQQDGLIALLCSLASSPSSSPSSSPPAAAANAAHYSDDDAAAANYINYGAAAGFLQTPCINNPLAASSAAAGIFHLDDSTSPFISPASASWEQLWT